MAASWITTWADTATTTSTADWGSTNFYVYSQPGFQNKETPAAAAPKRIPGERVLEDALEWLDRRVQEMQVAL